MAFLKCVVVILLLPPLSFILNLINVEAQKSHDNIIEIGCSLTPNLTCNNSHDHKNISSTRLSCWTSPSGLFAFGFYPQGNGFAVGIWIVNQTDQTTIVWTANRDDPPVSSMATLELTTEGLSLRDNKTMIESKVNGAEDNNITSAALLDSGSFVLYSNDSIIWDSFDYPTDTILGGQNLSYSDNTQLVSSVSTTNHSSGKFSLLLKYDGNTNLAVEVNPILTTL